MIALEWWKLAMLLAISTTVGASIVVFVSVLILSGRMAQYEQPWERQ